MDGGKLNGLILNFAWHRSKFYLPIFEFCSNHSPFVLVGCVLVLLSKFSLLFILDLFRTNWTKTDSGRRRFTLPTDPPAASLSKWQTPAEERFHVLVQDCETKERSGLCCERFTRRRNLVMVSERKIFCTGAIKFCAEFSVFLLEKFWSDSSHAYTGRPWKCTMCVSVQQVIVCCSVAFLKLEFKETKFHKYLEWIIQSCCYWNSFLVYQV